MFNVVDWSYWILFWEVLLDYGFDIIFYDREEIGMIWVIVVIFLGKLEWEVCFEIGGSFCFCNLLLLGFVGNGSVGVSLIVLVKV